MSVANIILQGNNPLNQQQSAFDSNFDAPSYMRAADIHAIANMNRPVTEDDNSFLEDAGFFVAASIASGAAQLYNIAPSIGNLLGGDFEMAEIHEVMQALDDDLGQYYQEHQGAVDTVGFILSSLVPGMAGLKGLKAVQSAGVLRLEAAMKSGRIGETTGKALGLLAPNREKFVKAAIQELSTGNSVFKLSNRNLMKAMAAGGGQSILEATAFEVAVAATMFESPVLEGQDFGDFVTNIAVGGLAFGAVGGLIDGARSTFAVRSGVKAANKEAMPWTHFNVPAKNAPIDDQIATYWKQAHNIAPIPEGLPKERFDFLTTAAAKKKEELLLRTRSAIGTLAEGDQQAAEQLFRSLKLSQPEEALQNTFGIKSISKVADMPKDVKAINAATKRLLKGKHSPEDEALLMNNHTAYLKTYGDEMGNMVTETPKITSIADMLKAGEHIIVDIKKGAVQIAKKSKEGDVLSPRMKFKFKSNIKWEVAGKNMDEISARHMWAQELPPMQDLFKKKIKGVQELPVINEADIPMLDKMYREFQSGWKVKDLDGELITFNSKKHLLSFITKSKQRQAVQLLQKNKLSQPEVAARLNMRASYLSGQESKIIERDIFAMQSVAEEHTAHMITSGQHKLQDGLIQTWKEPQYIRVNYNSSKMERLDGNVIRGMTGIKERERIYIQDTDRAVAEVLGGDFEKLVPIADQMVLEANSLGSGGRFVSAASSNYGSLAATAEYLGQATTGMIKKAQDTVRANIEPALYKLSQSQNASIEWSALSAQLRAIPDSYVLNDVGSALIPRVIREHQRKLAQGLNPAEPVLKAADAPLEIPIKNREVLELARAHIQNNGARTNKRRVLANSQGDAYETFEDVFYPPPVDTRNFPFFAIVEDNTIAGGIGAKKTIYANSAEQLEEMIAKLDGSPGLTIRTKGETEKYFKAIGEFEYEATMNSSHLDATIARKGVSSPAYIPTDPKKISEELLEWHTRAEADVIRGAVKVKYDKQFRELHAMGERFTNPATSRFGDSSLARHADDLVQNPFAGYERTALGLRNYQDYPWWTNTNRQLDAVVSKMYDKATDVLYKAKTPQELDEINGILSEHGFKGAAYDEGMEILANHTAPRGALSTFVARANSVLATVVLRLDALNSINNAVGAQVLMGTEVRSLIRAIERSDTAAAGKLAELAKVKVPGTEDLILSPNKLIATAIKKFGRNTEEMKFYKDNGFVTSISDQYHQTLDHLTLAGKETVKELEGKIAKVQNSLRTAADKGEIWTGNRLAEEFNRFIAADVMKQITDVAVDAGVMSRKEILPYINTFVNRTQGNYLAAQRPMLFQGPVGQAVGLFQTYQFNLMQQLLRHVGEGTAKDTMTLLGLQGTMYGMNGLPAFNAINTHLVGTASGNQNHRDLYDTAYGIAGKEAGNWLMYGLASNILLDPDLKVNLFTRGDINPRHVTLIPTDPAGIPFIQASAKFFANLSRTAGTLAEGGDAWVTFLQGLEHNGISRPLAGLAQTLKAFSNDDFQSYSTTKKGNVTASNDLLSLANLGRLVGGRPMDEAIAIDSSFRFRTYALKDQARRDILGAAIKTKVIAGEQPELADMEEFSARYAEIGGSQTEFNKWVMQLHRTANTSQSNKLTQDLRSPFNQSMQRIMGGYELKDFQ